MTDPVKSNNLPQVSALDEVLGNQNAGGLVNGPRRQAIGALAAQLAGTAPLSTIITDLQSGLGRPLKGVATMATTNITLSGEQTLNGVLTSASDVLVSGQSAPAQNGVYTSGAGAWTRRADADSAAELYRSVVRVLGGTHQGELYFCQLAADKVVGTDAMLWTLIDKDADLTGVLADVDALQEFFVEPGNGDVAAGVLDPDGFLYPLPLPSGDGARSSRGVVRAMDRWGFAADAAGDLSMAEVRARDARAVAFSSASRTAFDAQDARPMWAYNLVLAYGQSLSDGEKQGPNDALSTVARHGSKMIGTNPRSGGSGATYVVGGSTAFNDLVAAAGVNEFPGVSMINFMKDLWLKSLVQVNDTSRVLVPMGCGLGGQTVAQLSKGASPNLFGRLASAAGLLKGLADAVPTTSGVAALVYNQGENDVVAATTKAAYKAALLQLLSDFWTDVPAVWSQAEKPSVFLHQTAGGFASSDNLAMSVAQLEIARETPSVFMIGPNYPVVDEQGLYSDGGGHPTANGYRWLGSYAGHAMHEVLIRGRKWLPLMPYEAICIGRTVLITFNVPAPPLQFAPVWAGRTATDYTDKGFDVRDSVGAIPLLGVKLVGPCSVMLQCSRPPGPNGFVRYGNFSVHNGGGNLCDSDATVASDLYVYDAPNMDSSENIAALVGKPYPLNNWCVLFDQRIANLEGALSL